MRPARRGPRQRAPKHPKTLGERIWALRERLGLTQPELAARLGVTQATVSAWEKGVSVPGGSSWMNLSRVLGVAREVLEDGRGFSLTQAQVAAESFCPPNFLLPDLPPGVEALKLDRSGSPAHEALTPRQAQAALKQALAEGRPVWIVVG